jgi:hypothetical protein
VKDKMPTRYRLIRRGIRNGVFYCVDSKTGKRTSLQTSKKDEARQVVEAKNQAERQPSSIFKLPAPISWQAIQREEHERIIEREKNPEINAFYQQIAAVARSIARILRIICVKNGFPGDFSSGVFN